MSKRSERQVHVITRPAVSDERVQVNAAGMMLPGVACKTGAARATDHDVAGAALVIDG